MQVRTRFAPSPTGYLHIGGARTALFSWAYARRHGGSFILRIEDTDVARSTPEAVQAILDGMAWLDLSHDEGPFYQMQRMARYKEAIGQMLAAGSAYYCYTSREELDALRAEQEVRKEKPRYDGRWRPESGKVLPARPADVTPVVRFKNPKDGVVAWDDQVKGRIDFANAELDDLRSISTSAKQTMARPPITSASASTTGIWASPTLSGATTTSTTHRARSTSSTPSAPRYQATPTSR